MTKRHLTTYLLLLIAASIIPGKAETNATTRLKTYARHFLKFANDYPQEKVYLHFDNTAYFEDETIWFKAYVVAAEQNVLTLLSKTLYVELLSPEGNVMDTKKLKIENGQCHGNFELKKLQYSGFFEVRAYTRCMLNFEGSVFSRVFPVYDKPRKEGNFSERKMYERPTYLRVPGPRKEYAQKEVLQVSFYPEGGNLVEGIPSKVALKATSREGENVMVIGDIYDEQGNKVAEIEPGIKGMALFAITPNQGKYTAKVQYKNNEYTFELPKALNAGYAMSVDNTKDNEMGIMIHKSKELPTDTLGITISCRGKILAFDEVIIANGDAFEFEVPKAGFPTGVAQISLFNTTGEVVAERLVFINLHNELKMSVSAEKNQLRPFERDRVNFKISDNAGKPVETSFSVSIRDAASSPSNPYADNILTNLLLSSELKGYIEDPGCYLEKNDRIHNQALDLLMLVQGWTRYSWKKMAGVDSVKIKYPIEKSLLIDGRVLSPFKQKEKGNVEVKMTLLTDSVSQRGECITDKKGTFNFALNDFYGKGDLILQTKEGGKGKENYILLDRCFSPEVKSYSYYENSIAKEVNVKSAIPLTNRDTLSVKPNIESKNTSVKMDKKSHLLKEVTVKGKKKFSIESITTDYADVVYNVEKEVDDLLDKEGEEVTNIVDLLLKTNPYINVIENGDSISITYKFSPMKFFFLNDFSYPMEEFKNTLTDQIEKIVIIENPKRPELAGIHLYTYKQRKITPKGFRKTRFEGYSYVKEFFNPKYDNSILPNEKDFLRTLYWNPDVRTDSAGNASVIFYNNSTGKSIHVSAETLTTDGKAGVINQ